MAAIQFSQNFPVIRNYPGSNIFTTFFPVDSNILGDITGRSSPTAFNNFLRGKSPLIRRPRERAEDNLFYEDFHQRRASICGASLEYPYWAHLLSTDINKTKRGGIRKQNYVFTVTTTRTKKQIQTYLSPS